MEMNIGIRPGELIELQPDAIIALAGFEKLEGWAAGDVSADDVAQLVDRLHAEPGSHDNRREQDTLMESLHGTPLSRARSGYSI
jgi:hypothetical protein